MEEASKAISEFNLPIPPSLPGRDEDILPRPETPAALTPSPEPDLPQLPKPPSLEPAEPESQTGTPPGIPKVEIPAALPDLNKPQITAEFLYQQALSASVLENKFNAGTINPQEKQQLITLTIEICKLLAGLHKQQPHQLIGGKKLKSWYQNFQKKLVKFTGTEAPAPEEITLPAQEWAKMLPEIGIGMIQGRFAEGQFTNTGRGTHYEYNGFFGLPEKYQAKITSLAHTSADRIARAGESSVSNTAGTRFLVLQKDAGELECLQPNTKCSILCYKMHEHKDTTAIPKTGHIGTYFYLALNPYLAQSFVNEVKKRPEFIDETIETLYPNLFRHGFKRVKADKIIYAEIPCQLNQTEVKRIKENLVLGKGDFQFLHYAKPQGELDANARIPKPEAKETDRQAETYVRKIKEEGSGYIHGKFTTPEGGKDQRWGKARLHDGFQTRGHFGFVDNQTLHEQGTVIKVEANEPINISITAESLNGTLLNHIKHPKTTHILILQDQAPEKVARLPNPPKGEKHSLLTYGFHTHHSTIKDSREGHVPTHITLFLPQETAQNLFSEVQQNPELIDQILRKLYPEVSEMGIKTVQATCLITGKIDRQMKPGDITRMAESFDKDDRNFKEIVYQKPVGDSPA